MRCHLRSITRRRSEGRDVSGMRWRRLGIPECASVVDILEGMGLAYGYNESGPGRARKMTSNEKLLERILRGASDANIPFERLRNVLHGLGFVEHTRGGHHIFVKEGVDEILNLQPKSAHAKPYQVKQVRMVILKYKLAGTGEKDDSL